MHVYVCKLGAMVSLTSVSILQHNFFGEANLIRYAAANDIPILLADRYHNGVLDIPATIMVSQGMQIYRL